MGRGDLLANGWIDNEGSWRWLGPPQPERDGKKLSPLRRGAISIHVGYYVVGIVLVMRVAATF